MQRYSKITIGNISRQIRVEQRHFDPWDVDEIIPTMEYLVSELQRLKKKIHSLSDVLERCKKDSDDHSADPILCNMEGKLKDHCDEYMGIIEKIAEMGAIVDDMEIMAFDFYSWLEGEEVFLCWQSGEKCVSHWHYPEESFSDRSVLEMADVLAIDDNYSENFLN